MTLPIPKRAKSHLTESHRRSVHQEKETAFRLGGRTTKASGAGLFEKGDVRLTGLARIECKTTKHASFSVTTEIIDKIEGQAAMAGEIPVIEVDLLNGARGVYVMPKWALEGLLREMQARTEDKEKGN